eukprot:56128-Pyramimonas_sp.AAC.1
MPVLSSFAATAARSVFLSFPRAAFCARTACMKLKRRAPFFPLQSPAAKKRRCWSREALLKRAHGLHEKDPDLLHFLACHEPPAVCQQCRLAVHKQKLTKQFPWLRHQ